MLVMESEAISRFHVHTHTFKPSLFCNCHTPVGECVPFLRLADLCIPVILYITQQQAPVFTVSDFGCALISIEFFWHLYDWTRPCNTRPRTDSGMDAQSRCHSYTPPPPPPLHRRRHKRTHINTDWACLEQKWPRCERRKALLLVGCRH